jgi:hypothetical protein
MENMNLASRCRESISTLATLQKELVMSKKSQVGLENELSALRREVAGCLDSSNSSRIRSGKTNQMVAEVAVMILSGDRWG